MYIYIVIIYCYSLVLFLFIYEQNNEEQISKLQTEIKIANENALSFENQFKHEKEVNDVLLKQIEQTKQQCSLYKSQIQVNEQTIESLGLNISTLQGNSSGLVEENNTLKTTLGDQNKLIDSLKNETQRIVNERDELQNKYKSLNDEKTSLEGQLSKVKKLLSKSHKELQNKDSELLKFKGMNSISGISGGISIAFNDNDTFNISTCRLVNTEKWYLIDDLNNGKQLWLKEDDLKNFIASHPNRIYFI